MVKTSLNKFLFLLLAIAFSPLSSFAKDCSPEEYLNRRPDVRAAGVDVFQHYDDFGIREGMCRPVLNECSAEEYLRRRPDVAAANMEAIDHYLEFGVNEGMCDPTNDMEEPEDPQLPVEDPPVDPGTIEPGDAPNGLCSTPTYLRKRPDVLKAIENYYQANNISRTDQTDYEQALRHFVNNGRNAPENMCQPQPPGWVLPIANLPVGNWGYIDDSVLSLDGKIKGDPNSSQDLAIILALAVEFKSLPRFIGVTHVDEVLGTKVVEELIALSGLNIPIFNGSPTIDSRPSPLSAEIIRQVKKGKFNVSVGGSSGDVKAAVVGLSANERKNLTVYLTRNTFNESISDGATKYIADRVKIVQTPKEHLYYMLGKKNGPKLKVLGRTPDQWINSHLDLPLFRRAFSPSIIAESRVLNSFMHTFENQNPLRMADWHHVGRFFNIPAHTYDQHWRLINSGLNKIKDAMSVRPPTTDPEAEPEPEVEPEPQTNAEIDATRAKCTPEQYLARRADVARAGIEALVHYNSHGRKENMCNPVLKGIPPSPGTKVLINESLVGGSASARVQGGAFTGAGWKNTNGAGKLIFDLGEPIEAGEIEFEVTGLSKDTKGGYTVGPRERAHYFGFYNKDSGNKEDGEPSFVEIRYNWGSFYQKALKLEVGAYGLESRIEDMGKRAKGNWNPNTYHKNKIVFGGGVVKLYIDGVLDATSTYEQGVSLGWRYVFLGSINYRGFQGPIGITFRNLKVTRK